MDITTNNALTAVSYGAVGCVGAMAVANAVLVGAGAGAKAGAYVADYFKNESVAQNLRIKGDQLISLAGKYAATELKVAAALVAVGGGAVFAQYLSNMDTSDSINIDICKPDRLQELQGTCFDEAEEVAKEQRLDEIRKQVQAQAQGISPTPKEFVISRQGMPDVVVINKNEKKEDSILDIAENIYSFLVSIAPPKEALARL